MQDHETRRVGIAAFKARLSAYLRGVRRGEVLTLYDRDTPVARVVPLAAETGSITVRDPVSRPSEVALPKPLSHPIDSLAALLEERQGGR
jgi:antitoxin (DNA-binding transcriptional repressor) of toxin-antitoxin stability system